MYKMNKMDQDILQILFILSKNPDPSRARQQAVRSWQPSAVWNGNKPLADARGSVYRIVLVCLVGWLGKTAI
jgi:hypothetical protein